MVGKHLKPNIYHIMPVNGDGQMRTVNQYQLQDLSKTQDVAGPASLQSSQERLQVLCFNPKVRLTKSS